ncbi:MAG TPA: hypothetical protein VLG47_01005, partial [Candidatus Saccharimonadales bacterium]|nr:hypothetical protein [Candidatus Saccharimonadales bacterium]
MSLANKNTAGPTPEIDDRINPANRPLILLAPDGEIHAFVLNPHLLSGVDPTQMRPGTRSSAAGELQILTNHLLMQNG